MEKILNQLFFSLSREEDISRLLAYFSKDLPSAPLHIVEYLGDSTPYLAKMFSLPRKIIKTAIGNNYKVLKKYDTCFDNLLFTYPENINLKSSKIDIFLGSFLFSSYLSDPFGFLRKVKEVLKVSGKVIFLEKEQPFWERFLFAFSNLQTLKAEDVRRDLFSLLDTIERGRLEVLSSGSNRYGAQTVYFFKMVGFKDIISYPLSTFVDLTPPYKGKYAFLLSFLKNNNFSKWLVSQRENYFFGGGNSDEWERVQKILKEVEIELQEKISQEKLLLSFSTNCWLFIARK